MIMKKSKLPFFKQSLNILTIRVNRKFFLYTGLEKLGYECMLQLNTFTLSRKGGGASSVCLKIDLDCDGRE